MFPEIEHLIDRCEQGKSFGNVLRDIIDDKDIPQKEFANRISYSIAHTNRYINDKLPDNMGLKDIDVISEALNCSSQDKAKLVLAFICYVLKKKGLL